MITFGAGVLFGTPLYDATGTAIANPSPIQFGILQDVTVDESWETKELYGDAQFPVAVGRAHQPSNLADSDVTPGIQTPVQVAARETSALFSRLILFA